MKKDIFGGGNIYLLKNITSLNTMKLQLDPKSYVFEIDEKLIVDANEGEYVLYNRGDDRLTLTTCHPKYSARQRLVISGKLFKIESGN